MNLQASSLQKRMCGGKPIEIHQEIEEVLPGVGYYELRLAILDLGFLLDYEYGWMMIEKS